MPDNDHYVTSLRSACMGKIIVSVERMPQLKGEGQYIRLTFDNGGYIEFQETVRAAISFTGDKP